MVATPINPSPIQSSSIQSLEDWMQQAPNGTEWVNEELVEKKNMTLKHSKVQARIVRLWGSFKDNQRLDGEVYTEVPCRTLRQGRSPDVAYLTPELVAQYGDAKALPQSFPLSAEIVSPTDLAEDVIAKAQEYLQSGGDEVWLVFPDSRWVIVATLEARLIFVSGEVARTQKVLLGFEIAVDELLA
ncbi:MAG: Uma2 family endonuclease [Timaviella obliquedivisa GSE-PSE-MK23-08B]|jgi:Uma2 family endonuclease|nr:Uma2 family endonuclease [Timaviella obliquedivisa GSE-PSE-MK23-08B]